MDRDDEYGGLLLLMESMVLGVKMAMVSFHGRLGVRLGGVIVYSLIVISIQ